MKFFVRMQLAAAAVAVARAASCYGAETIRLAVQKTGTLASELAVVGAHDLDKQADLKGRKLAVAGGPIDKSWLLLQARLKQDGIDLKSEATIVYGAPPLLTAKMLGSEMDATINYWNFCAALEAKGFRRVAGIEDILPKLGAKGRTAMIGYVFDEKWANANQDKIARFIAMTRAAKEILSTSDA